MNLLKSEFRKLIYSRSFYGYILGSVALALLSSWPAAYAIEKTQNLLTGESLTNSQVVDGVYGKAISGYLFAILLGVAFMGNEYQNGMAISTFLATPKRIKVLYAKLVVAVGAGILMMLISTLVGFLGAYLGLKNYIHAKPDVSTFVSLTVAAIIAGAVLAIMGVAIGALVRNVRIASTGVVIWLGVVERLIVVFWSAGGKYLPSGLIVGMLNLKVNIRGEGRVRFNLNSSDYLGSTESIALLLLYAALFAGIALFTSLRRDVN